MSTMASESMVILSQTSIDTNVLPASLSLSFFCFRSAPRLPSRGEDSASAAASNACATWSNAVVLA